MSAMTKTTVRTMATISRKRPATSTWSLGSSPSPKKAVPSDCLDAFVSSKKTSPKIYCGSKKPAKVFTLSDYPEVKEQMKEMSATQLLRFVESNPELAPKAERLFKKMARSKCPTAIKDNTWKETLEKMMEVEQKENEVKMEQEKIKKQKKDEEKLEVILAGTRRYSATTAKNIEFGKMSTMELREHHRQLRIQQAQLDKENEHIVVPKRAKRQPKTDYEKWLKKNR